MKNISFKLSMKDPFHAGSVVIAGMLFLIMA